MEPESIAPDEKQELKKMSDDMKARVIGLDIEKSLFEEIPGSSKQSIPYGQIWTSDSNIQQETNPFGSSKPLKKQAPNDKSKIVKDKVKFKDKLGRKKARCIVWYNENSMCVICSLWVLIVIGLILIGYYLIVPSLKRIIAEDEPDPECIKKGKGSKLLDLASKRCGGKIYSTKNTPECSENCTSTPSYWEFDCQPKPSILINEGGNRSWCFQGKVGRVVVQFHKPVRVLGFRLSHLPLKNKESDAPTDFQVLGYDYLENEKPSKLGTYAYNVSGPSDQFFRAQIFHLRGLKYVEFVFRNEEEDKSTRINRIKVMGVFNPSWAKL